MLCPVDGILFLLYFGELAGPREEDGWWEVGGEDSCESKCYWQPQRMCSCVNTPREMNLILLWNKVSLPGHVVL
jgi:hypothetical protein